MRKVIEVRDLRKAYGSRVAVDGISFEVYEGEIFGMVGPNGAGKTTTIECLEGLRRPDSGQIRVLGLDPWRQGQQLRERIGIQLQEGGLPERLRVEEALRLFVAFYPLRLIRRRCSSAWAWPSTAARPSGSSPAASGSGSSSPSP
ncbi:MAG: ATP-binding cassette domain-containing protein [Thermoflexus sp.]|nr:ATP-binding cassette domain-containing protein [Thermoflexus sp.]MCS7352452.1 ATP-binding cassette domain-containing protein [Thermoflexus sp.]